MFIDAAHAEGPLTVFTGLKVPSGTSTKTVFQSLIEPFHNPGSSKALSSRPFFDLELMKPVDLSTYFVKQRHYLCSL